MKISYVNNHYHLGGAETVVRQLHEGALALGHDSRIHVTDGKSWPRARGLRPLYPRILSYLDHTRLHGVVRRFAPRRVWTDRAFRKLGHSNTDLVHVHAYHGHYASLESFATVARNKPLVWTFHRFWGVTGGCDHPGDCQRYLDACGDCPRVNEWPINGNDNTASSLQAKIELLAPLDLVIIAPSRHMARTVKESRVGQRWRVEYIPNGVNLSQFSGKRHERHALRSQLGLPRDDTIVLIVNREFTDPVKGFNFIRDAIAKLSRSELATTTFVLVGGKADWARGFLPDSARVVVAGFVSNSRLMADYYHSADVFLYASPGENFPCAIIEAMAARTCVVSTPTDGVLEQISDGETGLIASDFSSSALSEKLRTALSSPDLRIKLGNAARLHAQKEFSEETMISRHHELYSDLLVQRQQERAR